MRDAAERLRDILEAIAAINRYANRDKKAFEGDELLQGWFLRHLQIIGEAARALPQHVRALAPDIPWQKIIGMRNGLVHGYFEIDTDIVWDAATRDIPALKPSVERKDTGGEERSVRGHWVLRDRTRGSNFGSAEWI